MGENRATVQLTNRLNIGTVGFIINVCWNFESLKLALVNSNPLD